MELGFADKILYTDNEIKMMQFWIHIFGRRVVFNSLLSKLPKSEDPLHEDIEPLLKILIY